MLSEHNKFFFYLAQIIREAATEKMDALTASIDHLRKTKSTTDGVIADARKRNADIKVYCVSELVN